ncbi:MAG: hypothetical protein EBT15_07130 [Betaproteobacteria bacterium]|nr:hypothetical protein [Betaproteobacteria bacterium]
MQGYDPQRDAARLVEQYGPEVAQQMIAEFMRDRGMSDRNSEMWAGMDVRSAQRWANRGTRAGATPADLSDGLDGAPRTPVGDDARLSGGSEIYPEAGKPGYDRTFTPRELEAQRAGPKPAEGYPRVPKPRVPFGGAVPEPSVMSDPQQIEAYTTREWDGNAKSYKPSQKDRDMAARGLVPVLNPDGSVGYSVGYTAGSLVEDEPNRFPGASGRAGERRDLIAAGWQETTVPSPLGMQTVYRPGKDAQKRYDAQAEQRARKRIATSAGLSGEEVQSLSMDELRSRAQAARINDANARRDAWRAQAMLAGGQPTGGRGGSKAITNALLMLPEDERNQSLRYMLPGGDRAAAVDAANAATAGRMAQSAMSAFLTNNPMATPEQRAMLEQRAREANPAAAGAQDIAAGKPETPEGQAELQRLAESMDTGMFGVNTGDSSAMAEALMKPPYNLRRPEAEELAYRYMNRRSWFGIGRPGTDGSTPPAGVGPTPNPINPRVPLAAPSRPPGV